MDYIPGPDSGFNTWLNNFSTLLTAAPTTYGLTAPDAVIVAAQVTAWNPAYGAATDPSTRTPVTIGAKDTARATAEATVRPYATQIARNPGVADADKIAIGVTVAKTVPTPIPAPLTFPALSLESAMPLQHTLQYRDSSTPTSKAKPFGATGVQIYRAVGTVPAVDPAQATFYAQWTKSPNVSTFDNADRGKTCTYFARWITRGGPGGASQYGPWSAPLAIVVI